MCVFPGVASVVSRVLCPFVRVFVSTLTALYIPAKSPKAKAEIVKRMSHQLRTPLPHFYASHPVLARTSIDEMDMPIREHASRQLWMWINWTSVLWMAFCLAALIGAGVAVSPYLPLAVVVVPMLLAGLNSSRGICANWFHFVFAAVPFVLVTTVNSVLVFLYALATLDRLVNQSATQPVS